MGRTRLLLLATTALVPVAAAPALANPLAGVVVAGSADIAGAGTSALTVDQSSDKAIINWNTFDIGTGETTTFVQPSSNSVVLNRVTGGMGPSQILGTLNANGQVFVVNGDGILFGKDAVIDTGGLVATTTTSPTRISSAAIMSSTSRAIPQRRSSTSGPSRSTMAASQR